MHGSFPKKAKIDIKKFFDDLFYTDLYSNGKTKLYITNEKEKNLFLMTWGRRVEWLSSSE